MSPREEVAAYLAKRFRAAIPGGVVGYDDPLITSGVIDSFGVLEVIAFLEDTFHVELDPSRHSLGEFETINNIIALVERLRRS